jgi:steroid delta-isomerase-like uncharacterized protein
MDQAAMDRLFRSHREAEAARDFDGIIGTFTDDCYLDTVPLGRRTSGRDATRAAYAAMFTAFPDLAPDDEGFAFADDVMVAWGHLRGTSMGEWLGVAPGRGSFSVPFTNVATFRDGLMVGESIYFDLASLCEQAGLPLDRLRAAARG